MLFSTEQMPSSINTSGVRPLEFADWAQWLLLWQDYCALYNLKPPNEVTQVTWSRFFDPAEPVHCLVVEREGQLCGLAHYVFHRNTGVMGPVCYLQDLFTAEAWRGCGIGRSLIDAVFRDAKLAGAERVYWQTQYDNGAAKSLYDKVATQLAVHVYRRELD
jgi:GNAT superfamily N-acetyltransferase